ncbi:MAG: Lon protease family protein [Idiomarina sp.]|nr:Lon protease family protein [Idiomarina sp.]
MSELPNQHMTTQRLTVQQLCSDTSPWLSKRPAASKANPLVGQQRALRAIAHAQAIHGHYAHVFAVIPGGMDAVQTFAAIAETQNWSSQDLHDWVYVVNPDDEAQPICLHLPAGSSKAIIERLWALLDTEPNERAPLLNSLQEQFNWPPLNRYLQRIADKSFADLPGNELANIVVTQDSERPWHYCPRVTEAELFGQIRLQTIAGTVSSELHLIQPGALLKANGGTLVIDAEQLLRQGEYWQRLKHILKTGEFSWNQPEQAAAYYAPQPVPIKLKVILAGGRALLAQLRDLDADFTNLFPYLADFTEHYSTRVNKVEDYYDYLAYLAQRVQHRPLSESGLHRLLTISSSYTEHQDELSLDTIQLQQLLEEADAIAGKAHSQRIEESHLLQAVACAHEREHYLAELSRQGILEAQVKIDTDGEYVGQINGLTVVTMGGSEFGEPSRITATVHYGDGDIIDIERKSELSGNIHTKGVMILMAYLANLFAGKDPMPLSATLVFEQSYHEVDGDSASLAELCSLVSALSDTPIKQALAVTGAIDQFGNVQAIGGVNEKIEGFYQLCKQRGFSPGQGVIIPRSNQVNLHLSDQLIQSVETGEFSIFTIEHVKDAFELLMKTPCGTPNEFSSDTLFGRINCRIRQAQHHDVDKPRWKFWAGN